MKLSEMQQVLKKFQDKHGDIEVYLYSLYSGDYFKTNEEDFVTSEKIEGEKKEPEYLAILS